MSFWKKLFGGGSSSAGPAKPTATVEHKGFTITAEPFVSDGQYQVAGTVSKGSGDGVKSHRFIRADRCASIEDATQIALSKGRQIVDQQGERVFD